MHIILFSPIRYDYLHQRPQKLAEQFLAMGARVTFVQPTGIRDLPSVDRPMPFVLRSLSYNVLGVPLLSQGADRKNVHRQFTVISLPVTLPVNRLNSAWLERLNASAWRAFVHRELRENGEHRSVAIVQNPFWGKVLETGMFDTICYDCLDDISIYAGRASLDRFHAYEQALLEKADLIVTTAAKLEARLRAKTAKPIHRIPNGVDVEWFRTQATAGTAPADLAHVPRPIVGYVGSIAGWLDYDLIVDVARRLPDVSFVFVGPVEHQRRIQQLRRSSNIFWLGRKPYEEIPAYVNEFSVCSIPFRRGEIAQTTNPVKAFEYFALGKPVVSTPLAELENYAQSKLVLFADSSDAFAAAVKHALTEQDRELITHRIAVAAAHSWRTLARNFMDLLGFEEAMSV